MTVDFDNQVDPMFLLLENSTTTQEKELQIQGSASNVLEDWSNGAATAMDYGNQILQNMAGKMNESGITPTTVSQYQADYNTLQTQVSNLNNQYSNIMQGGGTIVSNLSQVEQQSLQLCQVTIDFQNNMNQLISQWAN